MSRRAVWLAQNRLPGIRERISRLLAMALCGGSGPSRRTAENSHFFRERGGSPGAGLVSARETISHQIAFLQESSWRGVPQE